MAEGITISGLDDCLRFFDNAPENVVKATRNALRDASKVTAKMIRGRMDKRFRRLVRFKVTNKGHLNAGIGLFNDGKGTGQHADMPDWFKAYWKNYGTLEGRDPQHHFDQPVNHSKTQAAKNRRNRMGIAHRNFYDEAITGWQETFVPAFRESMSKQEDQFYKR